MIHNYVTLSLFLLTHLKYDKIKTSNEMDQVKKKCKNTDDAIAGSK